LDFFFANQEKKGNSYQSSISDGASPAPLTQWPQISGPVNSFCVLNVCSTLSQPSSSSHVQEQSSAQIGLLSHVSLGQPTLHPVIGLQGSWLEPATGHFSTTPTVPAPEQPSAHHQQDCSKRSAWSHNHERYQTSVHTRQSRSRFFCPYTHCPRSTLQYGFARKDKLVDHLRSKKHSLSHEDALFKATMHNVRGGLTEKNAYL
jgi:hypothetical protein